MIDSESSFWMPFLIGKYLANTMHLTTVQHGAYFLLLIHYWKCRGPLPDDDGYLASVAKLSLSDWSAMRPTIAKFFKIENGKWVQDRSEIELQRFFKLQDARRQGAIKTNAKRWTKTSDTPGESPGKSLSDTPGDVHPHPHPHVPISPTSPPLDVAVPTLKEIESFGAMMMIPKETCKAFWEHYQGNNLWLNQHGRLIDVRLKLKVYSEKEKTLKASTGNGSHGLPLWRQVENLEDQISKHPANMSSRNRVQNPTADQKTDLALMRKRLQELKAP